jgi:hypothetical protein
MPTRSNPYPLKRGLQLKRFELQQLSAQPQLPVRVSAQTLNHQSRLQRTLRMHGNHAQYACHDTRPVPIGEKRQSRQTISANLNVLDSTTKSRHDRYKRSLMHRMSVLSERPQEPNTTATTLAKSTSRRKVSDEGSNCHHLLTQQVAV